MAADNTVTLVGNITEDPELRFTPSGRQVANFTVAVNRRFRNQSGQWEDKLDGFFRCSVWAEMAENVAESLVKGSRVVVVGRLQQRSWEDPEGNRRSAVDILVDEVGPSLRWATASVQKSQRSAARGEWAGPPQEGSQQPAGGGGQWAPSPESETPVQSPGPPQAPSETGTQWGAPAPVGGTPPDDQGGAG
jgi:single-strand DNA-binding protein